MQHAQQDKDAGAEEENNRQENDARDESDDESSGWCAFETIVAEESNKGDEDNESNEENNEWCAFETIIPASGDIEDVGKVTFKQANNVVNAETMRNKFLLDTGSTI